MKIGSFNVLNLKTDVKSESSSEKEKFKRVRIESIADIIRKKEYAVVALQEIQSLKTIKEIVKVLNGDINKWACVHCDEVYEDLNRYSLPGTKPLENRAELAFIYDTTKVEFIMDYVFYKGIHERFLTAVQSFITVLLGMFSVGLGAKAILGHDEDQEEVQDDEKKKKSNKKNIVYGPGAAVVSLSAVAAWFGMDQVKEHEHDKVSDFLAQTLRPPLVALFKPLTSGDRNIQLRMINAHSQFSYDKAPIKARQLEAEFLFGQIFHIVNTQRVLSVKNLNATAFTILAGDFNLTLKQLDKVALDKKIKEVEPSLKVLQKSPSTIVCLNKNEVETGDASEYLYGFTGHDYDHFVFDKDMWGEGTIIPDKEGAMYIGTLTPKHKDNPHLKAISDHHPIILETDQF